MSSQQIRKTCVIGAGVMGAGIAAHLANAGFDVLLLDMDTNLAKKGLDNALNAKPAAFFDKRDANRIEIGNLTDDLTKVKDCDWVIEVVKEDVAVKQGLFAKLETLVGPHTIISSNTSGLSIHAMLEGRSDSFKKRFLVTHFFNPVRYLHLLELVPAPETDPNILSSMATLAEHRLGKGVVYGKDTPNFVANRIGVFGIMEIIRQMQQGGYTIEEVDAVFGPAMGRPKSAIFRTADLVGLDTLLHVAQNCLDNLKNDEKHAVFAVPEFMTQMVQKGWLGQKSGQGFYKKVDKDIVSLDWRTLEYRPKEKIRFASLGEARNAQTLEEKIQIITKADDRAGQLAFSVTSEVCNYAANRLYEIADDIVQIDKAMEWGFGWKLGPFATWDAMGVRASVERMAKTGTKITPWVTQMLESGRESFFAWDSNLGQTFWDPKSKTAKPVYPKQAPLTFAALKRDGKKIVKDSLATSLVDLGDGILACEFHTKMNAIDPDVITELNEAIDLCEAGKFQGLVLANDGDNFSVGANILLLYMAAQQQEWKLVEQMTKEFQNVGRRLRYCSVPTVAAPFQLALGGGTELSMWCNRIRAHAETYMGLVEVGVGIIPGGGGTVELLARTLQGAVDDPNFPTEPMIRRAFETIAMAKVSTSAEEAKNLLYMRPYEGVTLNRDHLLDSAKQIALGISRAGYRPCRERMFRLPGRSAYATFGMMLESMREGGFISQHDELIGKKLAGVMTGGDCTPRIPLTEQHMLDLEREAFLSLCGEEKTMARIAYMLENNKPLRN